MSSTIILSLSGLQSVHCYMLLGKQVHGQKVFLHTSNKLIQFNCTISLHLGGCKYAFVLLYIGIAINGL